MLAILKGETAETGITLDERQNGETNPISHNQLAINGLRLGRGRRPRRRRTGWEQRTRHAAGALADGCCPAGVVITACGSRLTEPNDQTKPISHNLY